METTAKWHEGTQTGNPTQSRMVNNMIKSVKRAETRGIGQASVADRAFTIDEFQQVLLVIHQQQYKAMMCFQYHLIARGDDTAHVKKTSLKASTEFRGFLTAKIRWSKNVNDESNCPEQILLPSNDAKTCCYLNLAMWLEYWIQYGDGSLSQWLFAEGHTTSESTMEEQNKEAVTAKNNYAAAIRKALHTETLKHTMLTSNLGSHSIRKLATSDARRRGVSKDDVDYRARWKVARMQDRYTDIQLDWPDVQCASQLCQGGVIKYKVKREAGLTDDWVASNCAMAITSVFGAEVGGILGKALLWASFDEVQQEIVPSAIRHRCIARFISLQRNLGDNYNPVEKVAVIASEGPLLSSLQFPRGIYEVEEIRANRLFLLLRFCLSSCNSWGHSQFGRVSSGRRDRRHSDTTNANKGECAMESSSVC